MSFGQINGVDWESEKFIFTLQDYEKTKNLDSQYNNLYNILFDDNNNIKLI